MVYKSKGRKKITAKSKVKKNVTKLYAHWKFTSKINYLSNPREKTDDDNEQYTVFDTITFGSYQYEQESSSVEKKPIEWLVLSVTGNEALLLSKDGLDAKPFNESNYAASDDNIQNVQQPCTWKTGTIRSWLNGYPATENVNQEDYSGDNFIANAFNTAEQSAILNTTVTNGVSSLNGFDNGDNTIDKVFLLSYDEIMNPDYGLRNNMSFSGTKYAYSVSAYTVYKVTKTLGETKYTYWASGSYNPPDLKSDYMWLRTMVSDELGLAVNRDGEIMSEGISISGFISESEAVKYYPLVRPAIRVDLSNPSLWDYAGEKHIYDD